ncbi:42959_t:CDS:2, partial [Gigaspora margarita]
EQKCPLGEIDEFLIIVGVKTITLQVIVFEAGNYAVIVRNMTKYYKPANILELIQKRCKINIDKEELDKESKSKEEMESENEEKKKEYEDENLINKIYFYCKFYEILNEPETYKICSKTSYNEKICIFQKNL